MDALSIYQIAHAAMLGIVFLGLSCIAIASCVVVRRKGDPARMGFIFVRGAIVLELL
jgi:hypothetical protein